MARRKPSKADTSPVCFRAKPRFVDAITEAAHVRGWSRTTWILYWLGKGLEHDRELFGLDPETAARDAARRAAAVKRVQRWRAGKTKP